MFREYMYGESSMAEIVQKTGINRKTWNQRFSRLQRKRGELTSQTNTKVITNNRDKSESRAANVTINKSTSNNGVNKFLALIGTMAVIVAIYFIYKTVKRFALVQIALNKSSNVSCNRQLFLFGPSAQVIPICLF